MYSSLLQRIIYHFLLSEQSLCSIHLQRYHHSFNQNALFNAASSDGYRALRHGFATRTS